MWRTEFNECIAGNATKDINDNNAWIAVIDAVRAWFGRLLKAHLTLRKAESPRLAVLERVALAPRQSLALIEADGERLLVATTPEGAPAFYPLGERKQLAPNKFAENRMAVVRRSGARRRTW